MNAKMGKSYSGGTEPTNAIDVVVLGLGKFPVRF
jgi:hypothetical protein